MKLAFALAFVGVSLIFQLPLRLGAHPWWAAQILLIGAPLGLIAAHLTGHRLAALGFGVLAGATLYAALSGKAGFALSLGEDVTAGRIWYFGFIAAAAFATAAVASLANLRSGQAERR